ncbi:hypothetical protein DFP72DRAFT_822213, partial [Ephemerocybe angulata]
MVNHAEGLTNEGCSLRKNCKCTPCKTERNRGCENPTKCRRNALKKLENLKPEWDPRIPDPEATTTYPDLPPPDIEYEKVDDPVHTPTHPHDLVRIFTDPTT